MSEGKLSQWQQTLADRRAEAAKAKKKPAAKKKAATKKKG